MKKNKSQLVPYTMNNNMRFAFEHIAVFLDPDSLSALSKTTKVLRSIAYRQLFDESRKDECAQNAQRHLLSSWTNEPTFICENKDYWQEVLKKYCVKPNVFEATKALAVTCLLALNPDDDALAARALCLTMLAHTSKAFLLPIYLIPILQHMKQSELINDVIRLFLDTLKNHSRKEARMIAPKSMHLIYPYIGEKIVKETLLELLAQNDTDDFLVALRSTKSIIRYLNDETINQIIKPLVINCKNSISNGENVHLARRKMTKILSSCIPLLEKQNINWLIDSLSNWLIDKNSNGRACAAGILILFTKSYMAEEQTKQLVLRLVNEITNSDTGLQEDVVLALSHLALFLNKENCITIAEYIRNQPEDIYKELPYEEVSRLLGLIVPSLNSAFCENWALDLFELSKNTKNENISLCAANLLIKIFNTLSDQVTNNLVEKVFSTSNNEYVVLRHKATINVLLLLTKRLNLTTYQRILPTLMRHTEHEDSYFRLMLMKILVNRIDYTDMETRRKIVQLLIEAIGSIHTRQNPKCKTRDILCFLYPILDVPNRDLFRQLIIELVCKKNDLDENTLFYLAPILELISPHCNVNERHQLLSKTSNNCKREDAHMRTDKEDKKTLAVSHAHFETKAFAKLTEQYFNDKVKAQANQTTSKIFPDISHLIIDATAEDHTEEIKELRQTIFTLIKSRTPKKKQMASNTHGFFAMALKEQKRTQTNAMNGDKLTYVHPKDSIIIKSKPIWR